jgi:hypothetical protein
MRVKDQPPSCFFGLVDEKSDRIEISGLVDSICLEQVKARSCHRRG